MNKLFVIIFGIISMISIVGYVITIPTIAFSSNTFNELLKKSVLIKDKEEEIRKSVTNANASDYNDTIFQFKKAPEFQNIEGGININNGSTPVTIASLKGKVVLVNFWTYSCINTLRTLPYLIDWDAKYSDSGLVIVGIHTPEFEFEKNTENVQSAVHRYGIKYPVLQDNEYGTWNVYENNYWPRMYLIDAQGYIRYDKIGEGDYDQTEKIIQSLLNERNSINKDIKNIDSKNNTFSHYKNNDTQNNNMNSINSFLSQPLDFSKIKTPELYFGNQSARSALGNPEGIHPGQTVNYSLPLQSSPNSSSTSKISIEPSTIYLEGLWKNNADNLELQSDTGRILLNYSAKSINMVLGMNSSVDKSQSQVTVYEDDSLISNNYKGIDIVDNGNFVIKEPRLYNIVNHPSYENNYHSLLIDIKGKGFQAYVFTFG
ncbi:MAG: thioredoxin family protein [Candidatus Nitrosocosmicus sp.]|nr:thioredoxin family protein [Candidatus Nitrosocosmicus sp.]